MMMLHNLGKREVMGTNATDSEPPKIPVVVEFGETYPPPIDTSATSDFPLYPITDAITPTPFFPTIHSATTTTISTTSFSTTGSCYS